MLSRPKQETVTLVTLNLLQQAVDYLRRLPVVPSTHALIRQIDAHLTDPNVSAARREAEAAELMASRRTGVRLTPAGSPAYEVVVEGAKATITVHKLNVAPGSDLRIDALANGVTIDIHPHEH